MSKPRRVSAGKDPAAAKRSPSLKRKLEDPPPPANAAKKPAVTPKSTKSAPARRNSNKSTVVAKGSSSAAKDAVEIAAAECIGDDASDDGPEGLGLVTLVDAVKKGMRSLYVRLETDLSDLGLIGCMCGVYWPDDDAWYGGRIVLVSMDGNRCFVYYDDGMTEWVDLTKNRMTIFTDLLTVGNWAVQRVWVSAKAIEANMAAFQQIKSGMVFALRF
jgi:hypothetical protein